MKSERCGVLVINDSGIAFAYCVAFQKGWLCPSVLITPKCSAHPPKAAHVHVRAGHAAHTRTRHTNKQASTAREPEEGLRKEGTLAQ
jgi:hypothetical protein